MLLRNLMILLVLFLFKQKTAYEMRISDCSSDVCSSDLYRIDGDRPDWRPVRVFDDGRQIFIEFAEGVERTDMPPLFVVGDTGTTELVNYRVVGRYMIVDRLFSCAALRLASGKRAATDSIERASPRRKGRSCEGREGK